MRGMVYWLHYPRFGKGGGIEYGYNIPQKMIRTNTENPTRKETYKHRNSIRVNYNERLGHSGFKGSGRVLNG